MNNPAGVGGALVLLGRIIPDRRQPEQGIPGSLNAGGPVKGSLRLVPGCPCPVLGRGPAISSALGKLCRARRCFELRQNLQRYGCMLLDTPLTSITRMQTGRGNLPALQARSATPT
jgi:hypothetical protein